MINAKCDRCVGDLEDRNRSYVAFSIKEMPKGGAYGRYLCTPCGRLLLEFINKDKCQHQQEKEKQKSKNG